jgi:glutamate-1-semialdehyde 2,1-aminomutase/spore coat polysaccharide biosynthesis protein SpsF
MTTAVIVQARVGSSRLPRKVLRSLRGRPVLDHVLARCKLIPGIDVVVCAVPDEEASSALETVAIERGVETFRGSETDVLGRYFGAAKSVNASVIMRVTSDCPLIDPDICGRILSLQKRTGSDYASNVVKRSFPRGLDCEVFTYAVLRSAASNARDNDDREHVTPWMQRADEVRREDFLSNQPSLGRLRWTLDYPEDLAFLQTLFEAMPVDDSVRMHDVVTFLDRHPEIAQINASRQ